MTAEGNASALVPADDPRMIAWKAYQETEEYANSRSWALDTSASDDRRQQRIDASLWDAFCAGFAQGGLCVGLHAARRDAERVAGVLGLSAAASRAAGQRDR